MTANSIDRLEIGQNIFELIEFSVTRNLPSGETKVGLYGVNVAKVREVVRMPKINPLSSSVKGIAGIFELRGVPIPAVNLAVALGDGSAPVGGEQQIIVTEFSRKRAGFIVGSTHRIRRIAWDKVLPPASNRTACISGMTLVEDNEFLFILDLEKILYDIELPYLDSAASSVYGAEPQQVVSQAPASAPLLETPKQKGHKILLIDDSPIILKSARIALQAAGYQVATCSDGQAGKDFLEKSLLNPSDHIDLVVSDVEMPRMDGLTLTRWIKGHPQLSETPVVLHTSLSGAANQEAGFQIGANGYVVKNDMRQLTHFLKEILG